MPSTLPNWILRHCGGKQNRSILLKWIFKPPDKTGENSGEVRGQESSLGRPPPLQLPLPGRGGWPPEIDDRHCAGDPVGWKKWSWKPPSENANWNILIWLENCFSLGLSRFSVDSIGWLTWSRRRRWPVLTRLSGYRASGNAEIRAKYRFWLRDQ